MTEAACRPAGRRRQPLAWVAFSNGIQGPDPVGRWSLALVQFPGPWWGEGERNQTLLIDFPNLMVEDWVSIDRRQAIFIHDFSQEQKPGRPPRSCHTTSGDELTPVC